MTIEGITLTRDHLGEPMLCGASHDHERPTERGLLRGWDDHTGVVYVGFYSVVLEAYRAEGYAVDAEYVIWAEEPEETA